MVALEKNGVGMGKLELYECLYNLFRVRTTVYVVADENDEVVMTCIDAAKHASERCEVSVQITNRYDSLV
jgi:hypothetical protein